MRDIDADRKHDYNSDQLLQVFFKIERFIVKIRKTSVRIGEWGWDKQLGGNSIDIHFSVYKA